MERLFSTHQVHERDRFDYWHNIACKTIIDHSSWPEYRENFYAEIRTGSLGDISLVLFENAAMKVSRTAKQVARTATDDLFVCRQVAGTLAIEQAGRDCVLEAGDMALVDPTLPYEGKFSLGSKLFVLKVPRRELQARIGNTKEVAARALRPIGPEGKLTAGFLVMLSEQTEHMSSAIEETVRNQSLDLISLALAKIMDGLPRLSSARAVTALRVHAAIEARLTDSSLDANTVAAAAGVTVRYANAVLAQCGNSITRLMKERRLERCRKALEDPSQEYRTVSEIAYAWGFSDMTHFTRSFRAEFGILPSEYRRKAHTNRCSS